MWARLIAAAASPSAPPMRPVLPSTLRQLSSLDAKVLERYRNRHPTPPNTKANAFRGRFGGRSDPEAGDLASTEQVSLSLATLVALGLLEVEQPAPNATMQRFLPGASFPRGHAITRLGTELLWAVSPPVSAAE